MRDRQKRILRFLLTNRGIVRIEDIAATFSIGKRTVSRDLDILSSWLSLRGALLERKTNQGIQVITYGKSPEELLDVLNTPNSYIETLPQETRQRLSLLYLIFNNREIKISELSQTFFASDTTIWNDLNVLDTIIGGKPFSITRMKGVGIVLQGDEQAIRMQFIQILTELFSSHTIIPYLYNRNLSGRNTLELNQFRILMKRIHFPDASEKIMKQVSGIEEGIGYHYTMSGEAVLYFYLLISLHRIKSGAIVQTSKAYQPIDSYESVAENQLGELLKGSFSGSVPRGEIRLLAMLLQVLEIGDLSDLQIQKTALPVDHEVSEVISELISEFSIQDHRYYYLDDAVLKLVNITMSALITRIRMGIPIWHGEWGISTPREWNSEQKKQLITELIEEKFLIRISSPDAEALLMQIYALARGRNEPVVHKVRCIICCFEGIGLAIYLRTLIERDFPELDVIEATAVYKIEPGYIENNNIDLIITTYPIENTTVPSIQIALPLEKPRIKKEIGVAIEQLKQREESKEQQLKQEPGKNRGITSFQDVMGFISRFSLHEFDWSDEIDEIIWALASELEESSDTQRRMVKDFLAREALSPLFFEDYGIRMLHCKTSSVTDPRAGVISFTEPGRPRMIYLIAPDPCPDPDRIMLSEITNAFLSSEVFQESIVNGNLRDMRKQLLDLYRDFF